MGDTGFLRSDEPRARRPRVPRVDSPRTNVFHLPVRGNGDGGIYSTVADLQLLWDAAPRRTDRVEARVADMVRPRSDWPEESKRYGLGFHLHATNDVVWLEGHDSGVSFCSTHDPVSTITHTVISNTTEGAWPLVRLLSDRFGG